MSGPPFAATAEAIEALWAGDVGDLVAHLAEDVLWWEIGRNEPVCGRAEVARHLQRTREVAVAAEVHDVLANDEHIVTLIHASAARGGQTFSFSFAEVYHIDGRGQITKRQAFAPDTPTIVDYFE